MEEFFRTLHISEQMQQVLIAIGIALISWLLSRWARVLIRFVRNRITRKTRTELDDQIMDLVQKPVGRLIFAGGLYIAAHQLESLFAEIFFKVVDGLLYVWVVWIFTQLIIDIINLMLNWYGQKLAEKAGERTRKEFFPLVERIVKLLIITIAVIFVLTYFNQDVGSLIVSLGVGSLAIALAAQSTLANMIAGFTIMLDRPFRIGDRIQLASGEKGDVFEIGIRSTKILTFENTLLIIPNDSIVKEKVLNLSYPSPIIRVKVDVGVAYGSDPEKVKEIMVEVARNHPEILEEPEPAAYLINFGDSSLDMTLIARISNYSDQWRIQEELRVALYEAFDKNGIEIPFPQRVVHLQKS